jgi:hypothetical protein
MPFIAFIVCRGTLSSEDCGVSGWRIMFGFFPLHFEVFSSDHRTIAVLE